MSRYVPGLAERGVKFVEVADGRLSRLHCVITFAAGVAALQDTSSHGTFVNGTRVCIS